MSKTASPVAQLKSPLRSNPERVIWGTLLLTWFIALCFIPDPRPLAAPDWAVSIVRSVTSMPEPSARAIATISLRVTGIIGLGILVSLLLASEQTKWAIPAALLAAPLLAILSLWVNYGHFPIKFQIPFAVISALIGALAGFAIRRNRIAAVALIVLVMGVFAWGASTGVSNQVDLAARAIGRHLHENTAKIPKGDKGFSTTVHAAFTFAEENSSPGDAVMANKAAIVALGVILGEEKVARVARRRINLDDLKELRRLRKRITLQNRNDLSRHFWVSAALVVLSDEKRSTTVGIGKELMDAAPGGSGFSFVDLSADRAGIRFAVLATKDARSAQKMQTRIRQELQTHDFLPEVQDLPEGLTRDEFQQIYGGLGGAKTKQILQEIERRLSTCAALVE